MKSANQLKFFDTIWDCLSQGAGSLEDEEKLKFILLFCLVWSYSKFRHERPTQTEYQSFDQPLRMKSVPMGDASGIYVFPACDITLTNYQSVCESRFMTKVRGNLPKNVQGDFHQILRDYTARFCRQDSQTFTILFKPYIRFKFLLPSFFLASLQVFKNLWVLRLSWSITTLRDYLTILKSLILYYSNFRYFQTVFTKNDNLTFVVVSNFYSPENLALIAVANRLKIDSFDIQHGVQKNVIAYERLRKFPTSLRPTKIVNWTDEIPAGMDAQLSYRNFLDGGIIGKRCLVTLQPSNSDSFLDDLNLLADTGMKVIVRPHPRRNGEVFLAGLSAKLYKHIQIRSNTDLADEFNECDIHFSEYSSSLLESASAGGLSVALHETALTYMYDEIRDGKIIYFSSLKAFILDSQKI